MIREGDMSGSQGGPPPLDVQPTTTPSGLQYADIVPGSGTEARLGQQVTVHYTGWLTNGRKVDSSRDKAEFFSFTPNRHDINKR
jgi:FKBP-type peptidyl-prolyl cis-trans isomerase